MSQHRLTYDEPVLPPLIAQHRYAVIDCESTGLNRHKDEVIQLALVQVDHGRLRFRVWTHVQPTVTIHPAAGDVHGIDFATLQHAPPFGAIAEDLLRFIGTRTVLGWSCDSLDIPVLKRQFAEAGMSWTPTVIDILKHERRLAGPSSGKHNLGAAAERWGVPSLPRHDALNDCRTAWNIFVTLAGRFPEFGALPLEEALTTKIATTEGDLAL